MVQGRDDDPAVDEPGRELHEVHEHLPPGWFTPMRLLLLFCIMQFLVYCDRGVRSPSHRAPLYIYFPKFSIFFLP